MEQAVRLQNSGADAGGSDAGNRAEPAPSGAKSGAPPTGDGVTRSQHVVHTLPHTTEAIAQLLPTALERMDATAGGLQLVIVTADAETAIALSDVVHRLAGPTGIEIVPVTSANRAARLVADRPIHAVAGPAIELQTLVQRSVLKLATTRTIVLAWTDDILRAGGPVQNALEVLLNELPKESSKIITARQITPEVEQFIDRYARTARRVKAIEESAGSETVEEAPALQYVVVSPTARGTALRRLLDDVDPPSAAIVVRSDESRTQAAKILAQLGYRRADDPIRVVDGAVEETTHTVVLFDAPVSRAELANVADGVVQTIALVTPAQLETLRAIAGDVAPFTLSGPAASARAHTRALQNELAEVLAQQIASHELLALEPLLERYDGAEIAAAALRLLERERAVAKSLQNQQQKHQQSLATTSSHSKPAREPRSSSRRNEPFEGKDEGSSKGSFKRQFGDRPKRDFSDRPKRDFGDRAKRDFGDRPKRDFGDRPKRDFGDRPPRREESGRQTRDFRDRSQRDFGDRRKRNFGRGPRHDR